MNKIYFIVLEGLKILHKQQKIVNNLSGNGFGLAKDYLTNTGTLQGLNIIIIIIIERLS